MNKKVVLFGGGTGLSNLLSELKKLPLELTAVVTIADNGGSTGRIRNFYDIPAPGDIRRCALALTEDENLINLMNYRFDKNIDHHTVGNLVLTAFTDIYGSIQKASQEYCNILNVKQKVYPISNDSLVLCAQMQSGVTIYGEHQIATYPDKIEKLFYEEEPKILPEVLAAIKEADAIVFSCGSLYTSIISTLLFKDLITALDNTKAQIIYVCNLMTQRGETEQYKVSDHVKAINKHLNQHKIDVVIANNNYEVKSDILENYKKERASLVRLDDFSGPKIISENLLIIDEQNHIRHNLYQISQILYQQINTKG